MYSGRNTLTFRTRTVTFFKINLLLLKVQNIYINFLFKTVPDTNLYETSNLREAMKVYHGGNMYVSGSEKITIHEETLQRQGRRKLEKNMFDVFMPAFCILTMNILYGVVPSVADEGV